MIEITRLLAKQLRTVVRKLLGNVRPDVIVRTGPFGLIAQVQGFEHAVQYHDPAAREPAELTIPSAVLDDVQGQKADPVVLSTPKKDVLAASWEERGVARSIQYTLPKTRSDAFPALPESMAANPPALMAALHRAFETSDQGSSKYALGCIQLRGKTGQIVATDGHQLLLQSGFAFGFEEELLVPRTGVFGCSQLPQDQPVQIGRMDQHVAMRVGPWTFAMWIHKEGRFPEIEHHIPTFENAATTLDLAPADVEFFLSNLNRLPGTPEEHAVTLELNGSIAIRAKTLDTPTPTELVLTNSSRTGEDVRISIDRRFLARAAAMGFGQICLHGPDGKLVARDGSRQYLWMPLNADGVISASPDCLRIESPHSAQPAASRSRPAPPTTTPMSTNSTVTTPASAPETKPAVQPQAVRRRRTSKTSGSVLEQAVGLRDQLRTTLTSTKELIRALKAEKRSQKSLKLALDSLKQLQAAA